METMFLASDTLIQAADVLRSAARRIEAVCRPLEHPDEDLKEFRGLKAKTEGLLDNAVQALEVRFAGIQGRRGIKEKKPRLSYINRLSGTRAFASE